MTEIHELYAYLRIQNATAAIDFYKRAFGAEELFRLVEPGGRIGHAELKFGPTTLMLADEYPKYGIQGPEAYHQIEDVSHEEMQRRFDAMFEKADK